MTAFWLGVIVSIVTGALVNEFCDLSPWLATRMVRRAARRWAGDDDEQAAVLAEEWAALIDECPGQVTKVLHALRFAVGASGRSQRRHLTGLIRRLTKSRLARRLAPSKRSVLRIAYRPRQKGDPDFADYPVQPGMVIGATLTRAERDFINLMDPKDRARVLLQRRVQEKSEMAVLLSQLQALRHQTAMTLLPNGLSPYRSPLCLPAREASWAMKLRGAVRRLLRQVRSPKHWRKPRF